MFSRYTVQIFKSRALTRGFQISWSRAVMPHARFIINFLSRLINPSSSNEILSYSSVFFADYCTEQDTDIFKYSRFALG